MANYSGRFSNGQIAARRDVVVSPGPTTLGIADRNGSAIAEWPYDRINLAEEVYRNRPARLRCSTAPDALLTVEDAAILHEIADVTPHFRQRNLLGVREGWRILTWSVVAFVTAGALIWALPRLAEPVAAVIPQSWEEALGRKVVSDIMIFVVEGPSETRFCESGVGLSALDNLTARLAAGVETPYRFSVRVARAKMVNAFAAPGGQVIVFKGLLDKAESAEEVAGVLAHEMAHVVERHATEGIIRALGLTAIIAAISGDTASFGGKSAELGATLIALSYSRQVEAEADRIGVAMLNAAGIRAEGLAGFFERLSKSKKPDKEVKSETREEDEPADRRRKFMDLFSTHPASRERAAAIRAAGTGTNPAMTEGEWEALRTVCDES